MGIALSFSRPVAISSGEYSDCEASDIIVMTAGAAQEPGKSRLQLVERNADIFRDKEVTLGASYAYSFPRIPLRSQMDVQFFRYKEFDLEANADRIRYHQGRLVGAFN